jgi:hypothetical protein
VTRAALCAAFVVVLVMAFVPGAAGQAPDPPCPAGTPAPTFTVNGKVAPVHTTHELTVRVKAPGDGDALVDRLDVSGARPLPEDFQPGGGALRVIADSPGTLTASALISTNQGPDGNPCALTGSASFEVRPAELPTVTKLRRPRPYLADPPLLWDTDFRFRVQSGATADRTPLTVEARAILRAKLPGPRVGAGTRAFTLRASDPVANPDRRPLGTCGVYALVCPPKVRTWPRGAEVSVYPEGRTGIRIEVTAPRGYPLGRGIGRTPFGVDIRVLQSAGVVARLRIAGVCIPFGQFSDCRLRTLSTKIR